MYQRRRLPDVLFSNEIRQFRWQPAGEETQMARQIAISLLIIPRSTSKQIEFEMLILFIIAESYAHQRVISMPLC